MKTHLLNVSITAQYSFGGRHQRYVALPTGDGAGLFQQGSGESSSWAIAQGIFRTGTRYWRAATSPNFNSTSFQKGFKSIAGKSPLKYAREFIPRESQGR